MTPAAAALAASLDEAIALHERLIELTNGQRRAVAAGQVDVVEMIAGEMERAALRLARVEEGRQQAAAGLADELGVAATRWSAIRDRLDLSERLTIGPRVDRLEALVRELELANAINGELIRREMELMDFSIRGLMTATQGPSVQRYSSGGRMVAAQDASPILLNTTA